MIFTTLSFTFESVYGSSINTKYVEPLGEEVAAMPYDPLFEAPPGEEKILDVDEIGMSVPLGIAAGNVQGVQAKLRAGMKNIELGFPAAFKGNRQAHVPGMYGKEARQALDEIRRVTEVDFTTHAPYGLMGLTGVDQRGNFSWTQRKLMVDEVRRAIDFAADTAKGGAIVVHTGEFERPMSEETWAKDPETGRQKFRSYIHEPMDAQLKVLDDRTGQIIQTVQKDRLVPRPIWLRAEQNNPDGVDQDGKTCYIKKSDYVDYDGKKIVDPYDTARGRVPSFDSETQRFKQEMWHYDDFVKETEERNRIKEREIGRPLREDEMNYPEEIYLKATLETQEANSRGWALYYGSGFDKDREKIKKLEAFKDYYKKVEKNIPEDEQWKIKKMIQEMDNSGTIPAESKLPTEIVDDLLSRYKISEEQKREAAVSLQQQAMDARETMKHIYSQKKRMILAGWRSYAEAGIHAMRKTTDTEKPLFVAMENIFPDRYGGHPEELKSIVRGARSQFVDLLTSPTRDDPKYWNREKKRYETKKLENQYYQSGTSKQEAERLAEKHIKVTFDTGHLNLWRKYWIDNPKKTQEQNHKDFDNWLLKQTEGLAKEKMIGHIHLTDNFGYQDDHLAPGQGNTPVKEMMKIIKKHGFKGQMLVEPGADADVNLGDTSGLFNTWRHFGTPVHHTGAGAPMERRWTDIQHSYFGKSYPPYFIFGAYAPSNEWTLWSGVNME